MTEPDLVSRHLERILANPAFARARRSSQLLRFLVETTLAGRENELKEYSIATQVFGRPASFDPRLDSLVRVEATRLRERLRSYYAAAGEQDVEIQLPPGSYTPVFRQQTAAGPARAIESPAMPAPGVGSPGGLRRLVLILAGGFALMGLAVVATGRLFESAPPRLGLLQHLAIPGEVLLSPVLAPDSRLLYYASNRNGGHLRIWRQQLEDRNAAEPLTSDTSDSYDLDLSPDGVWMAYYSSREGGGLYQQMVSGGPEILIATFGRSPRFSLDSKRVLFWVEEPHTGFGKVFSRLLRRTPEPEEPRQIAGEFTDSHTPMWTPDGRVLICGTLRSNVKEFEHDLWVVPAEGLEPPIKTGILPYLKARHIDIHSRTLKNTSFRFYAGALIFTGARDDKTSLFTLRLTSGYQPRGEPVPLHAEANSQDDPSTRGALLAFTSARTSLGVWRIPLGDDGVAAGEPVRLTESASDDVFPGISRDGSRLVYLALRTPAAQVWKKDLATGVETQIYRAAGINRLKVTPDGSTAFFRILEGRAPQLQTIYALDVAGGPARKICDNCGAPTSISPSGEFVAHETGSAVPRLAVIDLRTGERREILRHHHHGVQGGRISPDGHSIVFELDRARDGIELFAAPFRGLEPIPETGWIPISDPSVSSFEAAWSPDGSSVYFLSDRSGSRDLWMQRLQPDRRAMGQPALVRRFADPRLTPLTFHMRAPRYVGLSISARDAVLTLSEMNTSVWLGRLGR